MEVFLFRIRYEKKASMLIDENKRAPTAKEWSLHMPKALIKWGSLIRVMEDRAEAKYPITLVTPAVRGPDHHILFR